MRKAGRPPKTEENRECKEAIIKATVELISALGADAVTVRKICQKAEVSAGTFYHYFTDKNDLMMEFLREESFDHFPLKTPEEKVGERQTELYLILVHKYMELGRNFMKSFYTTGNVALSAYLDEEEGHFQEGTIMARSESELIEAVEKGYLPKDTDAHTMAMDICTIVKGTVFEWCLTTHRMNIETTLLRLITRYLSA